MSEQTNLNEDFSIESKEKEQENELNRLIDLADGFFKLEEH